MASTVRLGADIALESARWCQPCARLGAVRSNPPKNARTPAPVRPPAAVNIKIAYKYCNINIEHKSNKREIAQAEHTITNTINIKHKSIYTQPINIYLFVCIYYLVSFIFITQNKYIHY